MLALLKQASATLIVARCTKTAKGDGSGLGECVRNLEWQLVYQTRLQIS